MHFKGIASGLFFLRSVWACVLLTGALPALAGQTDPGVCDCDKDLVACAESEDAEPVILFRVLDHGAENERDVHPVGRVAGGATLRVRVAGEASARFCAALVGTDEGAKARPVRVLEQEWADGHVTLVLRLPAAMTGAATLYVVGVVSEENTRAGLSVAVEPIVVTAKEQSVAIAMLFGGLLYLAAAAASARGTVERFRGFGWLSPVAVTTGRFGKTSLSLFQVFVFSLLVVTLLVYVYCRHGYISDLSSDLLTLIGITAGGGVLTKVVVVARERLTLQNWTWLRRERWLTIYESGTGAKRSNRTASWDALLKSGGDFDVYRFQLVAFGAAVALALTVNVVNGAESLAGFALPANLAVVLGLSNVVYLGGKTVSPDAFGELDKKITEASKLAGELQSALLDAPAIDGLPAALVEARAAAAATDEAAVDRAEDSGGYDAARAAERVKRHRVLAKLSSSEPIAEALEAYLSAARVAADMLVSLYGDEESPGRATRFNYGAIQDGDLVPLTITAT